MNAAEERELLAVAREAARAAASELVPRFGGVASGVLSKSSPTDLVSDADVEAERAIRAVLRSARPDDPVLGEEGGGEATVSLSGEMVRWVVDPLDGTTNYLFGIPMFAVSVACEDARGVVAGVVLDPMRGECFEAVRSGAASLDGAPVGGSERSDLATALVATGFGYSASVRERQASVVASLLPRVRDIRRCGAAALDLCWCACGRFDAYYERGVKPWDVAAGTLIAERAGLEVRSLVAGFDVDPDGVAVEPAGVVVAPGGLMEELYAVVGGGG